VCVRVPAPAHGVHVGREIRRYVEPHDQIRPRDVSPFLQNRRGNQHVALVHSEAIDGKIKQKTREKKPGNKNIPVKQSLQLCIIR
jgi:hypothetical protein